MPDRNPTITTVIMHGDERQENMHDTIRVWRLEPVPMKLPLVHTCTVYLVYSEVSDLSQFIVWSVL